MKRLHHRFYIWTALAFFAVLLDAFFITAAIINKPFNYFGHMNVFAITSLNVYGEGEGSVIIVNDFDKEPKPNQKILVTRLFDEGYFMVVEEIINDDEDTGMILTNLSVVFDSGVHIDEVKYQYVKQGGIFEYIEYISTQRTNAIVFSVSTGIIALSFIGLAIINYIDKRQK